MLHSPFDETAIDFLEDLDVPAFKLLVLRIITSLIKKAAATGKPLIVSTGLASLSDLDRAVTAARDAGCSQLVLLSVLVHILLRQLTNILTIPHLSQMFNCQVGLDHTMGVGVSVAAVALGRPL